MTTIISWDELIKNRKPIPNLHNSALMLGAIRRVKEKHPDAHIEVYDSQLNNVTFVLINQGQALSGVHHSHYACWLEALEAIDGANH